MTSRSHADILKLANQYKAEHLSDGTATFLLLSSNTVNQLVPYLVCESVEQGHPLGPVVAPYNQFEQVILDPGYKAWTDGLAGVWIHLRLEDVYPQLVERYYREGPDSIRATFEELLQRFRGMVNGIRNRSGATVLVSNLHLPLRSFCDIFDANREDGLCFLIGELNRRLASMLADLDDAHVFDVQGVLQRLGWGQCDDPKLYYMARMGFGQQALQPVAHRLTRSLLATRRAASKVLVLDLDNTLWGGVLGDDGIEGIKIGGDYPGNIFADFQRAMLAFRAQGYLLAISSKNDDELVRQALNEHPEMVLRETDFSAIQCNWDPKPVNLRRIAESLNLGLDSFVFIDDSPVERNMVQSELPEVRVVDLPSDPHNYLAALQIIPSLDKPRLLVEDQNRAEMYQQEAKRAEALSQVGSMDEFLASLEMKVRIGTMEDGTQDRIHQLIQKTNQFNLTTRRHSMEALRQFADCATADVYWLRLEDRFGDLGIVAVAMVAEEEPGTWGIDSFLMSCRVMNRQVESSFLAWIIEQLRGRYVQRLNAYYSPTRRSHIVRDLYPTLGFAPLSAGEDGSASWQLELDKTTLHWAEFFELLPASSQDESAV